ncbi:alpha/beta hydrolase [Hyphomicrobium methylovorum]|uniref:alpha/beta fold hydrolase n=1 Tax=Hyphomicrobium methylovorum TaxID=84 RepID=UPI0015E7CB07|nr:alpha/beta hydrolase [Hyphomicrobium methylovorum]MBA2126803.1 alpha/beta hydrolase [Hyphomicrobium methylovorum]
MNLVSLSINPVPSGATVLEFRGYDGLKLRAALWEATRGPSRGTVCIVEGRAEFIEKYFEVIADLRRRGFAVAIFDLRGQGGSDRMLSNPRKGHVVAFTEYDRDLAIFIDDVVRPSLPEPLIGLGHSLGGNILLRNAQDEASPFARMVLISPMIAVNEKLLGVSTGLARAYATAASLAGLSGTYVRGGGNEPDDFKDFATNRLTQDHVRWSRNKAVIEAAPDLVLGSPTVGWLRAALRGCAMLQRPDYPKYVAVPMLLFAAGADTVVSAQAIEDFAVDLKTGGHILVPGSRHEILQETDAIRQRFWAAFDAYMGIAVPNAEQA